MKILITGGYGFLGSNLAAYAIKNQFEVFVLDNLYRIGSVENLAWLKSLGNFTFIHNDIRNTNDLKKNLKYIMLPLNYSDQQIFVDITKAQNIFKWQPQVNYKEGINKMLDWIKASLTPL